MRLVKTVVIAAMCALPVSTLAQSTRPSTRPANDSERDAVSLFGDVPSPERRLSNAVRRLSQAEGEYEEARNRDAGLRADLRGRTGRVDVSRNNLETYADKLDKDLEALSLEQAGATARMAALEEALQAQMKRVEAASKEDTVIAEYQKVADARERQYAMIERERKAGLSTDTSLQDAIAALAEARAKVAERRQAVFTANGGDTLAALNRELLNLSIADRERQAKIKYLGTELKKLSDALSLTQDLQLREKMMAQAIINLQRAQSEVTRVRSDIADRDAAAKP
jgi:chromosome segregation ATPase